MFWLSVFFSGPGAFEDGAMSTAKSILWKYFVWFCVYEKKMYFCSLCLKVFIFWIWFTQINIILLYSYANKGPKRIKMIYFFSYFFFVRYFFYTFFSSDTFFHTFFSWWKYFFFILFFSQHPLAALHIQNAFERQLTRPVK